MRNSLMKRIKSFEKECILHVLGDCALYIVPLKKRKKNMKIVFLYVLAHALSWEETQQ